jgi:hypothetical protein
MYRKEAFEKYFVDVLGGKPSTYPTYRSFLGRIDKLAGGLDEKIEELGAEGARAWAKAQSEGPFETYGSHARSVLNSYLGFVQEGAEALIADPSADETAEPAANTGALFKLEKEMQAAIRLQLAVLEPGLVTVDDGVEVSTATGRIDILAKDATGSLVAIELKVGLCPPGAIEQVLGYAQSLSDERGEPVRAILIAGAFTDRQKAAVKRVRDLTLTTYAYQMSYSKAV